MCSCWWRMHESEGMEAEECIDVTLGTAVGTEPTLEMTMWRVPLADYETCPVLYSFCLLGGPGIRARNPSDTWTACGCDEEELSPVSGRGTPNGGFGGHQPRPAAPKSIYQHNININGYVVGPATISLHTS